MGSSGLFVLAIVSVTFCLVDAIKTNPDEIQALRDKGYSEEHIEKILGVLEKKYGREAREAAKKLEESQDGIEPQTVDSQEVVEPEIDSTGNTDDLPTPTKVKGEEQCGGDTVE
eukprot:m.10085 g.10085  ORF g.10085 m.10085 type:complete len:114 (+) comp4199_c0_seq1:232-573(+)